MNEPFVMEPHNFSGKICHWSVCVKCGLIRLRNDFTQWAIRKGCNNEDHPDHARQRAQAGKP
jgi:hypothetical protein